MRSTHLHDVTTLFRGGDGGAGGGGGGDTTQLSLSSPFIHHQIVYGGTAYASFPGQSQEAWPWSMELEIESAVGEGGGIQKSPNEHAIIM